METKTHHRLLIGAALLAAGLCLHGSDAVAEKLLYANSSSVGGDPNCRLAGTNTAYYAEAWGFAANGSTKVCEVSQVAGSPGYAVGMCVAPAGFDLLAVATQHSPRVTIRGVAEGSWASPQVLATGASQTTWTSPSAVQYNVAAQGSCPAVTITAASRGYNPPGPPI